MIKPWSKQIALKQKEDIPTQNDILEKIYNSTEIDRNKALISIAYLTAGRISEVVREKALKKVVFKYVEVEGKKTLVKDSRGKPVVDHIEKIPLDYPGICRKNISYALLEDKKVMIVSMQNRKNKKQKRKNIPILIEHEKAFVEIIEKYADTLELDASLFPFNKHQAYNIISRMMDMNCHFLRDIRLTHLVTIYGRDGLRLQKYAGWSDLRPAQHYVHLNWRDIWK